MSLENVIVEQLPTELLQHELKRRGVEPVMVPGLEQAPDIFVVNTLLTRMEDDSFCVPVERVKRVLALLHHHFPDTVVRYIRSNLDEVDDDVALWDAITDKMAILEDRCSDDELWDAMTCEGQAHRRVDGTRMREVLDGLREQIVSAIDDAVSELGDP